MAASLYVAAAYNFNHVERSMQIDRRLLDPVINSTFYFVDKEGAPKDSSGHFINEIDIKSRSIALLNGRHSS